MRSLQSKLGSGLILSLIVLFTALWLLISFNVRYLAEEYISSRLRHDAEMLLSKIRFDTTGNMTLDETAIDPLYHQPFSGHYYLISSGNHTLNSRSLWDKRLLSTEVNTGEVIRHYQDGPEKQSLLLLSNGFSKQGNNLVVTVAEDLNPVRQNIRQFQTRFAIAAMAMLLFLVILQAYILRHSLKSITRLHGELQDLQRGEADKLSTDTPSELQPLIQEVNHLLTVLAQRLRRSRDAVGDLAHAIKRPLTIIQQLTEEHGNTIPADVKQALTKQVLDINQLTDRILKRARLAGHRHSGARFSFSQDLPDLIDTLNSMYRDKSISTQINVTKEVNYPFDREDMLELLGNLLDNAYKWASQTVGISISSNDKLTLCIEDDGPGVDPELLQQLDRRGVRLDESTQGYGFGLAIVSDMVREYNGSLAFSRSEKLGGFRVDITLPNDGG